MAEDKDNILNRTWAYLLLSVLLSLVILSAHLLYHKADIHLWLNSNHTSFGDFFWHYYTYIGEWVPYLIVVVLLFYKAGYAAMLSAGLLLSGLTVQIIKHIADTPRPYTYFSTHFPDIQLPFVDGVRLSRYFSFPSGHTATFFAVMFILAIIFTDMSTRVLHAHNRQRHTIISANIFISFICFVCAAAGAYSRIYLSQHFLEDIYGGIITGICSTLILIPPSMLLYEQRWWNWRIRFSRS